MSMRNMEGIIFRGERQNQGIMVVMEDMVATLLDMEEGMVEDMVEDMVCMAVVTMAKDLMSLVMDMVGMEEVMVHMGVDMEEDVEAIEVIVEDLEVMEEDKVELTMEKGLLNLDMVAMEAAMEGDMVEGMDLVMVGMVEAMVEAIL